MVSEEQIQSLIKEKQFSEVLSKLSNVEDMTANLYRFRGDAKYNLSMFESAIDDYTRAIALDKENYKAYNNRANAEACLNFINEALNDYNKAVEIKSDFSDAYFNRGLINYNLQNIPEAIEDYTKAIEANNNNYQALNNRGNAFNLLGKYELALEDFSSSLKIMEHANTYFNRGLTKENLSDLEGAKEDYTKALEMQNDNGSILKKRALVHFQMNELEQSYDDYFKALSIDNNDIEALLGLGNIESRKNNNVEAINYFTKACDIDENCDVAYISRAISASAIKDYDMSIADLEKLFNLNLDKDSCMLTLNGILEHINKFENKDNNDIEYENTIKDYIEKVKSKY